jgi:hypothetical protein
MTSGAILSACRNSGGKASAKTVPFAIPLQVLELLRRRRDRTNSRERRDVVRVGTGYEAGASANAPCLGRVGVFELKVVRYEGLRNALL